MDLSPSIYHLFVRPKFFTKLYICNNIQSRFDLNNKQVLDFGCGVGSNSIMCDQARYLGIDPDAGRVQYAKRLHPEYSFAVFNGKRLPVDNQSVDFILIVAVLHHIPTNMLTDYLKEFRRVLKPYGKVLVMEPCLFKGSRINNWFMSVFDKGKYIRSEVDYMDFFRNADFTTQKLKQFKKMFFYNEIFFTAAPNM